MKMLRIETAMYFPMKENETMAYAIDRLLATAEDAGINIYAYSDDSVEVIDVEKETED